MESVPHYSRVFWAEYLVILGFSSLDEKTFRARTGMELANSWKSNGTCDIIP